MRWGTSNQETHRLWSGGKGLVWGNYAALTAADGLGGGLGRSLMAVTKPKLVSCRKLAI